MAHSTTEISVTHAQPNLPGKIWIIGTWTLLLGGMLLRLTALFPVSVRHDSCAIALQGMRILEEGYRPLFWPGQDFMGAHGGYLVAGWFALWGKTAFAMNSLAYVLTCLTLTLYALLARKIFGWKTACLTALLLLIPNKPMMYWAGHMHTDYQLCFFLVPCLFLTTLSLMAPKISTFRGNTGITLLGLLCGLTFWNNMQSGPAIAACLAALCWHTRWHFFKVILPLWIFGFVGGFSPVIGYYLQEGFRLGGQVSTSSLSQIPELISCLATHAWPFFLGVHWSRLPLEALRIPLAISLSLITGLFGFFFFHVSRNRRSKSACTGGVALVSFFLGFQILTLLTTHFGNRLCSNVHPSIYFTSLYAIAYTLPAYALTLLPARRGMLLLIPFMILAWHNFLSIKHYPTKFFDALEFPQKAHQVSFPDPTDPVTEFIKISQIKHGYMSLPDNKMQSLLSFDHAIISESYKEHNRQNAIAVDAARQLFWIGAENKLRSRFRSIGASFLETSVTRPRRILPFNTLMREKDEFILFYDFSRTCYPEQRVQEYSISSSVHTLFTNTLRDQNAETKWVLPKADADNEWIRFDFSNNPALSRIVLIPENSGTIPKRLRITGITAQGNKVTLKKLNEAGPMFWSEYHPFQKKVKPRMEIVLPDQDPLKSLQFSFVSFPGGILSFCEIYLYASKSEQAFEKVLVQKEQDRLQKFLETLPPSTRFIGDHWWMNYLALKKRQTAYISNSYINDTGKNNPQLKGCPPEDFSQSTCLIASRPHASSIRQTLQKNHFVFEEREFLQHILFMLKPNPEVTHLYWDGLDLLYTPTLHFKIPNAPPLKEIYPKAHSLKTSFGSLFHLNSYYLAASKDSKTLTLFFDGKKLKATDKELYLFVHFLDLDNRLLFQGDIKIENLLAKYQFWPVGKIMTLERKIKIPPNLPDKCQMKIGIWHPQSGQRLFIDESGQDSLLRGPLDSQTFESHPENTDTHL